MIPTIGDGLGDGGREKKKKMYLPVQKKEGGCKWNEITKHLGGLMTFTTEGISSNAVCACVCVCIAGVDICK